MLSVSFLFGDELHQRVDPRTFSTLQCPFIKQRQTVACHSLSRNQPNTPQPLTFEHHTEFLALYFFQCFLSWEKHCEHLRSVVCLKNTKFHNMKSNFIVKVVTEKWKSKIMYLLRLGVAPKQTQSCGTLSSSISTTNWLTNSIAKCPRQSHRALTYNLWSIWATPHQTLVSLHTPVYFCRLWDAHDPKRSQCDHSNDSSRQSANASKSEAFGRSEARQREATVAWCCSYGLNV